ncbi:hypothetical protein LOK49_LG15G00260 [Camellia lanceoleosa]|uniref:Uncharacterized protein n=1 Tax=Camellia lanceoleosa TaxID=1840588 RepID=A0ACC0F6R3_9ERIC|nr:hypothetical protein LOK49_LG15G00260 [Camellia lanceoleosa]
MDFFVDDKQHHSKAAVSTGDEKDLLDPIQMDFNVKLQVLQEQILIQWHGRTKKSRESRFPTQELFSVECI